jgi:hypothetical protein
MRDNHKIAEKEAGVAMDLSDVPNILWEPDEYRRVKLGEGNRGSICRGRGCRPHSDLRVQRYRAWQPIVFANGDRH